MIIKERINTKEWGNCLQISNSIVTLLVSLDFGPRALSYKFKEGRNVFFEDPNKTVFFDDPAIGEYFKDRDIWYNYGGHRLWINPENMPQTFHPDTDKVEYNLIDNGAVFFQREQLPNKIKLSIEFQMSEVDSEVTVIHRVQNTSDEVKEFAIWCISPMASGGTLIVPMGELEDGALPNRTFSIWPYTDLSDKRLYMGRNYFTLLQEPGNKYNPVNIGYNNGIGISGYLNNGTLFLNTVKPVSGGKYSDNGSAFETYSDENFIEVESLGELKTVQPGETVEHIEKWSLIRTDEAIDYRNEESIGEFADKYIKWRR